MFDEKSLADLKQKLNEEETERCQYVLQEYDSTQEFAEAFFESYPSPDDSLEALRPLAKGLGEKGSFELEGGTYEEARFYHGDVHIKGSCDIMAPFLVTGNLTVDGTLSDCGPDSMVVVLGDVKLAALHTNGEFHVEGDITAEHIIYGAYNDNVLCARKIKAPVVVSDDHCIMGEVEATHFVDIDDEQERLEEVFVEGLYDSEDECLLIEEILEKITRGENVFRA